MTKWEYRLFNRRKTPWDDIRKELNELGAEGWDAVSSDMEMPREGDDLVVFFHALLKRPLVE